MSSSENHAEQIVRERSLRESGEDSSVLTIPPIVREFTEFSIGSDVEISAEIGGDEMRLRIVEDGESDEPNEN